MKIILGVGGVIVASLLVGRLLIGGGSSSAAAPEGTEATRAGGAVMTVEQATVQMKSPDVRLRQRATLSYSEAVLRTKGKGQKPTPQEIQPLIQSLTKDESPQVRGVAATALGRMQRVEAVPILVEAMEDKTPAVRQRAHKSVQKLTGISVNFEPNASPLKRAKAVKAMRDLLSIGK